MRMCEAISSPQRRQGRTRDHKAMHHFAAVGEAHALETGLISATMKAPQILHIPEYRLKDGDQCPSQGRYNPLRSQAVDDMVENISGEIQSRVPKQLIVFKPILKQGFEGQLNFHYPGNGQLKFGRSVFNERGDFIASMDYAEYANLPSPPSGDYASVKGINTTEKTQYFSNVRLNYSGNARCKYMLFRTVQFMLRGINTDQDAVQFSVVTSEGVTKLKNPQLQPLKLSLQSATCTVLPNPEDGSLIAVPLGTSWVSVTVTAKGVSGSKGSKNRYSGTIARLRARVPFKLE
ncbi:hypothetical protein CDEST_15191 [Colletotrichum destructivum]|uniref:Uncharacterized protein n=1 Tax=Colletotrichum destructivum TaxID=34406 RepID=A0AAX4J470_9PEZI|nr:hypothetical protein CDEST_15191 [Colletotrichum destructivum]